MKWIIPSFPAFSTSKSTMEFSVALSSLCPPPPRAATRLDAQVSTRGSIPDVFQRIKILDVQRVLQWCFFYVRLCDEICDSRWLYVICMWYVCDMYVICMWYVCDMYVICMWYVCDMYVICMWYVCDMYVICMWYVWYIYIYIYIYIYTN